MLVQALAAYADQYLSEELGDEAWEEKPVPTLIEIGADGTFLGAVERLRQETRGKKTITLAQSLRIPKSPVNRNSGLHPLLAADDIKYVLGVGAWTPQKDERNATERCDAFVSLIRTAAAATGEPGLEACVRFYERADQVQLAREALKTSKPGQLIALSVDGPLVLRAVVRDYWTAHFRKAFQQRVESGGTGECLISGTIGPIAPTHEKIKGTASLGGQSAGVLMMSFDKPAFRSYGWEQNANSPIGPERAMAYVLALNDLLRSDKGRRKDIAGVGFVYWTRKPAELDLMFILDQATKEQVSALLRFDPEADPDPNMFYMAGVSANGGRLLIRHWLAEHLAVVKANLKGWFEGLRVVSLNGRDSAAPPKLWQLRFAIERDGEPTSQRGLALIRRAMQGPSQPLGHDMLTSLLSRLRHPSENATAGPEKEDYRFAAPRMGLLRLCLNDTNPNRGGRPMTEALDPEQNHPAYLCGRMLAEFEGLQEAVYKAAGETKVNVTIADRYYSLASTNPRVAFPKIEQLAKSHFRKLRRDKPGAMVAIERRVIDLHERLGPHFPACLNLDGQGRFALGYYHQKSERNRQIAEYSERKTAANSGSNEQESAE